MSRLIEPGLEELSKLLFKMGDLAERTVNLSFESYMKGRNDADKVQVWSETLVSLNEEVEDKGIELIARYQPVAGDLRTIKSYMKISYDLARYGRYAWDIIYVCNKYNIKFKDCMLLRLSLKELVKNTENIVHTSIEAVKKHNLSLVKKISVIENDIDQLYFKCLDKLVNAPPTEIKCVVSTLLFIRHLERIADHASYIGEAVVYLVTAEHISLRGELKNEI